MPKPKSGDKPSFHPLQLISPGLMLLCLILFFLPWIEIVRHPSADAKRMAAELKQEAPKSRAAFSQSGLQIAIGGVSPVGPEVKPYVADKDKERVKAAENEKKSEGSPKDEKERPDVSAPMLMSYPLALLAGVIVGCIPLVVKMRRRVVGMCVGLALPLPLMYTALFLPIERETRKQYEKARAEQKKFLDAIPKDAQSKFERMDPDPPVSYPWQWAFYLSNVLLIAAACTVVVDGAPVGTKPDKRPGRREAEDDEDDRPRRRRRDEEDDEDDDRPRKRRRHEEEEEDDRPRKRRRDEDEEDDRPRKKRPPEPEFDMPDPLPPPPAEAPAAAGGANPFDFDSQEQPRPPRARDEEDDRPRRKRRDEQDDEDDRPRKKRRAEDDEDDRPRRKKPAEPEFDMPAPPPPPPAPAGPNPFAFDEDDQPRKKPRRRDDDDDDYDDRPRKKRRRDDD
jgi:hypothetical protein